MADDRIDVVEALDDLARHLPDPDPDTDVVGAAMSTIARAGGSASRRRAPNRWAQVAAAAAAAVALTAAIPASRDAVADLLGIGGVRIRLTGGVPGDLEAALDLGEAVDLDEAAQRAAAPLAVPADVGDPAAAFAGRPPGGVTLVWAPSQRLPEVLDSGVGLLLTTFPGALDRAVVEKRVLSGTAIEQTTVDGAGAWFISGEPHTFLYVAPDGTAAADSARLSGNALVWERAGVTHRLESALPLAEARRLAESLEPLER